MRPATVGELLDETVARVPAAPALLDEERRLTYGELADEIARAVGVLADLGVRRGTTVAASAVNGIDLVVAFVATMELGARWVGIGRVTPAADCAFMLQHCRARVLLTDRDDAEQLRAPSTRSVCTLGGDGSWRAAVRAADARRTSRRPDPLLPAAIAYTSGTTGRPKGVVHSQHNLTVPGR